jgi:HK97 family phage prohead protease
MTKGQKPKIGAKNRSTFALAVREVNQEDRRVKVSFSSEIAVFRWYGIEYLQHDLDSVDLERINDIGVSLFNHQRDYVLGRIENAYLEEKEKRCYCDIVFDDDPEAEKIFTKVNNGTLKGVSVGYMIHAIEEVSAGKTSSNGRFEGPCEVVTRWEPMEVSVVSVPADDSVGIGRDIEGLIEKKVDSYIQEGLEKMGEKDRQQGQQQVKTEQKPNNQEDNRNLETEREEAIKKERQRVSEINSICREFDMSPDDFVNNGNSVDEVREAVLSKLKAERKPLEASVGEDVRVTSDEVDKIREAASDAIIMRGGIRIEKPADGAMDFRGMKLRDLAIECLERLGVRNAHRLSDTELFKRALTPDSQFSSILSSSVNKSMSQAYRTARTTYKAWVGKGSNTDFKTATHYRISEAGDLERVYQNGEIKFDQVQDEGVSKKVCTYARMWGFTREAMINDDLSVLTKMPAAYVRAAERGINKAVYAILGGNPKIYDGIDLFHTASHKNLASSGSAPSVTAFDKGEQAMRKQKNQREKETLNIAPRFVLSPASLGLTIKQIIRSTADPAGDHAGVANVYENGLEPVIDAELDNYSSIAWYLAADPDEAETIEVTYLNGQEEPILESQVGFEFLGILFRIIADYGVTALDYRAMYKDPGSSE